MDGQTEYRIEEHGKWFHVVRGSQGAPYIVRVFKSREAAESLVRDLMSYRDTLAARIMEGGAR